MFDDTVVLFASNYFLRCKFKYASVIHIKP